MCRCCYIKAKEYRLIFYSYTQVKMNHLLKEIMKISTETSEESIMFIWGTQMRENIEEKIVGMDEDRKIK